MDDWSDRVEQIIDAIHGYLPARGCLEMNYVDDDPMDVQFMSGKTSAAWQIVFECVRFVDSSKS